MFIAGFMVGCLVTGVLLSVALMPVDKSRTPSHCQSRRIRHKKPLKVGESRLVADGTLEMTYRGSGNYVVKYNPNWERGHSSSPRRSS